MHEQVEMDLAHMIVNIADTQSKQDVLENALVVEIKFHCNKYTYVIEILPMNGYIIIKYKELKYRLQRTDHGTYKQIIGFLLDEIAKDVDSSVNWDIEWGGYWPNDDEGHGVNTVSINKKDQIIFTNRFISGNLKTCVWKYVEHFMYLI